PPEADAAEAEAAAPVPPPNAPDNAAKGAKTIAATTEVPQTKAMPPPVPERFIHRFQPACTRAAARIRASAVPGIEGLVAGHAQRWPPRASQAFIFALTVSISRPTIALYCAAIATSSSCDATSFTCRKP